MVPEGTHTTPLEHRELVELRVERFLRETCRPVPAPLRRPPGRPRALNAASLASGRADPLVRLLASATKG